MIQVRRKFAMRKGTFNILMVKISEVKILAFLFEQLFFLIRVSALEGMRCGDDGGQDRSHLHMGVWF